MGGEIGTGDNDEALAAKRPLDIVGGVDDEVARGREKEVLDTVRRWGKAVTAAEHSAIYGSSARDYEEWAKRQPQQEAS